jgi:toxin-antitoxin system PIN domain toxin
MMLLCDVNVLVYAHREDAVDHDGYRTWLERQLAGRAAFGWSDLVASGFLRVVTNRRVFPTPTPLAAAIAFLDDVRRAPVVTAVTAGPRHWDVFVDLCRRSRAAAALVPDAYLAALAIESGCEWATADRGFARFPGLRVRHPLEEG